MLCLPLCPATGLARQQTANLIANPSLEASADGLPAGWRHGSYGTNTPYFSYLSTGAPGGARSLLVTMSGWTDGDAKWYFQRVPVTPGKAYYFSDSYKASALTTTTAEFWDAAGAESWERLGADPKSESWRRTGFVFTVPPKAVAATILHSIAAEGTLQTCEYSLVETTAPAFRRAILSLTFDDGYRSVHDQAWPVLRRYGFTSTQYIVSGAIGSTVMFDHPIMTGREIADLHEDGDEIGSHSATHPHLTRVRAAQLESELSGSKAALAASYPPVDDLALPYGDYDDSVIAAVKKRYASSRTSDSGYNTAFNFDPYRLRIKHVQNGTPLGDLQEWLARAARDKAWLVLLYHSVDRGADDAYSVTPEAFAAQMDAIHASGLAVLTVRQALDEIGPQLPK